MKRDKNKVKNERIAPRKETYPVRVSHLSSTDNFTKIAKNGEIVEASSTGLLMQISRKDLVPQHLRNNLNIDCLIGDSVFVRLVDMDLEISGVVARTQFLGKEGFLIAIDYTADAPEYWRECLMELLPTPHEFD